MFSNISLDYTKTFQVIPSIKSSTFLLVKRLTIRNLNLIPIYESILLSEKDKYLELQNVIPITDFLIQDKNLFLISESISSLSLNDFLKKKPNLLENEIIKIIHSVVSGVEELRRMNLSTIHGNINKNNVFLLTDIDNHIICKLTDYHQIIKNTGNFQNSYSIAPELLEKKNCFLSENLNIIEKNYAKADIWSIGWLLYELLYGKELWDYTDLKKMVEFMTNDDNSSFFANSKGISDIVIDFLKNTLVFQPSKRMEWTELVTHPIFANMKYEDEKIDVVKIDISKFEISIKKEETYAKFKFEVKGLEGFFPDELIINAFSNEFNLINRNYDFEIIDLFGIFSEISNFQPYEGKICFKAFDKLNQKNFIFRVFKVDIENADALSFLKDCCFEYVVSKIQKKIGLNVLPLYEIFFNFFEGIDFTNNYLILVYDDFNFFLQDLFENLFEKSLELNVSQKLFTFLSICKELKNLKHLKFDKIQAVHPQNIVFFKNKITNKIGIKLAFFNDVNSQKEVFNELQTPSLLFLNEKVFEDRWKSIMFYLGTFFYQLITEQKYFNRVKSLNTLNEMNIDKNIIDLFEKMVDENFQNRIILENLVDFLQTNPLVQDDDMEFLKTLKRSKNNQIDEIKAKTTIPEIYELLFQFNKAIIYHQKVLDFIHIEKKLEEEVEIYYKIAKNYLFLLDYDKCNSICYKALSILQSEKIKTEKSKIHALKYYLNLMNGISLMALGLSEKSLNYLEQASKSAEKIRSFNPFAQPICLKYICDNQKALGKTGKALSSNEKCLEFLKKNKEESAYKKKLMIEFLLNFSQTYLMMENYTKAIEFCNDALMFQRNLSEIHHPLLKQCYVSLGNLNFLQGYYDQAVTNFELALNINSKIFPPEHETFIDLSYDLGTVYSKTETNPMNYLKLFEQALELFNKNPNIKKSIKEKKEQYSLIHSSIARTYYSLNKFDKAIEFFQKALNLDKELYPDLDHLRIVEEYLLLGNSYSCLSNYEIALRNCEEALKLAEKQGLPETDEKMMDILMDLGDICTNLKKVEAGVTYYERIIKILEKNKKFNKDTKIFEVYLALSNLYMTLGNADQAIKALLAGQQKYKAINKNDYNDPIIVNVLNSMGALYSSSNTFDKASKSYSESLEISRKFFPDEEKNILDAIVGLAICYYNLEDFEKAVKYFQEALEIKEKKNEKSANMGDLCSNLGHAFKSLKNRDEAKKYFEKAVEYYNEYLPKNHKDLIAAVETLKSLA